MRMGLPSEDTSGREPGNSRSAQGGVDGRLLIKPCGGKHMACRATLTQACCRERYYPHSEELHFGQLPFPVSSNWAIVRVRAEVWGLSSPSSPAFESFPEVDTGLRPLVPARRR